VRYDSGVISRNSRSYGDTVTIVTVHTVFSIISSSSWLDGTGIQKICDTSREFDMPDTQLSIFPTLGTFGSSKG